MNQQRAMYYAWAGALIGALFGVSALTQHVPELGGTEGPYSRLGAFEHMVFLALIGAILGALCSYALEAWLKRRDRRPSAEDTSLADLKEKTSYLRGLITETKRAYLGITEHAMAARAHLTSAQREFTDGAFAPFWDEIESAANQLAGYKSEVEHMLRTIDSFQREAMELKRLTGSAPLLPPPDHPLPDARLEAARFATIVRRAQTDFQFAMIYEQRKTNQILYAGFGTLGSAIGTLGESIAASLKNLSATMNLRMDNLLQDMAEKEEFFKALLARPRSPAPTELRASPTLKRLQ